MSRAGKTLLAKSREFRRQRLRKVWPRLLVVALMMLGLTGAGVIFLPYPQFVAGVGIALTIVTVVYGLNFDGGASYRSGAFGEQSTARVLKPLKRQGWRIEHSVQLAGRDIDHVLIGPAGAVAVESKWRGNQIRITTSGPVEIGWDKEFSKADMLHAARRAASNLDLVLRAVPGHVVTRVTPVLVLWGPLIESIEGGAMWIDGVLVAAGHQAKRWRPLIAGQPLTVDEVERAWASVMARIAEHRADAPKKPAGDDQAGMVRPTRAIRRAGNPAAKRGGTPADPWA